MNQEENIGKKIKEKRLSNNLTMDYVAKKTGITRATLSSIENGSLNCSLSNLLKVLRFLKMSLNINSNDELISERKRATRLATLKEKEINRFIVFCVEQYAESINKDSEEIYEKMKNRGIIKDLHDDYDFMHGMSIPYINNYIASLIR